ncbi:uncharacterized protein BCR38DRAFT_422137 [Pseudomassariella vexata]|uniref:Uncharacterized protein n=1 Tax=Pseudomassariella vexata TaxID=1141098 RepID=A0A1Y2EFU1_9PEZI|nr:uncharacterized protein BCR38DRAFT_422137 [Pseudomassariella vexata]ORY70442.1 hypothetical protein BCR38DRAFT_422137 [Pseudomassariella vexata]
MMKYRPIVVTSKLKTMGPEHRLWVSHLIWSEFLILSVLWPPAISSKGHLPKTYLESWRAFDSRRSLLALLSLRRS